MADKKQEKKADGFRASSSSHKAGMSKNLARQPRKKVLHALRANRFSDAKKVAERVGLESFVNSNEVTALVARREAAKARRKQDRLDRREAKRVAARVRAEVAAKKAQLSERAKKGAVTRAANKAARLAATATNEPVASV